MNTQNRTVFHADCNSFFASVEETFHPEYKQVPMAVAGDPENRRGIILAKNELAKKFNIKTAETIWSARQKCPDLLLCPPRHHTYGEFCERVNAIYEQYTDQVERFGVDESFLDVTGSLHLFGGDAVKLAHEIRERVAREIGITISIGVSWNKMFAKLGSDLKKPNAVTVITRENYKDVVWPLPAGDLFLVGRNTVEKLQKMYIKTIGDLARADEAMLTRQFGKMGTQLHINANGLDDSPVARIGEQDPVKSVGNGLTFRRDLKTEHDIRTGVIALADSVASRLRAADMKCTTVQVTIKDTALKSIQRQKPTKNPTYLAAELAETAMEIIKVSWNIGKPIRMITVTAQNLVPSNQASEQLTLFDEPDDGKGKKTELLEKTMDKIRGRYGSHSIQPGVILKNDLGISDKDDEAD
jgi:DNA polymerase-4